MKLKVGQVWHCQTIGVKTSKPGTWRIERIERELAECTNLTPGRQSDGPVYHPVHLWDDSGYRWTLLNEECIYPEKVELSLCAECNTVFVGLDYLCQSCR